MPQTANDWMDLPASASQPVSVPSAAPNDWVDMSPQSSAAPTPKAAPVAPVASTPIPPPAVGGIPLPGPPPPEQALPVASTTAPTVVPTSPTSDDVASYLAPAGRVAADLATNVDQAYQGFKHSAYSGIDKAVAGAGDIAGVLGHKYGFTPPNVGLSTLEQNLQGETAQDAPAPPSTPLTQAAEAVGTVAPALLSPLSGIPYMAGISASNAKERAAKEAPNATPDQLDQNIGNNALVGAALGAVPGLNVARGLGMGALTGITGYAARTIAAGGVNATMAGIAQALQNAIDAYTTNPNKVLTEGVPQSAQQGFWAGALLHGLAVEPAIRNNPPSNPLGDEPFTASPRPGQAQLPPPGPSNGNGGGGPPGPDITPYLPGGPDTVMRNAPEPTPPPPPVAPAAPRQTRADLADMLASDKTADQLAADQKNPSDWQDVPPSATKASDLSEQQIGGSAEFKVSPVIAEVKQLSADGFLNVINTSNNRRMVDAATDEYQLRFPEHAAGDLAAQAVTQAAQQVDTNPTEAQQQAGNYQKGHVWIDGMDVSIEHPMGSTRSGTGPTGEPWEVTMPSHYGYIRQTEGADGEHMDTYVADGPPRKYVYVIDQIDPATGAFDEHKAMLNYPTMQAAVQAYQKAFSDGSGPSRMGGISEMAAPQFKEWLKTGDTASPLTYKPPVAAPVALPQQPDKKLTTPDLQKLGASLSAEPVPEPTAATPIPHTEGITREQNIARQLKNTLGGGVGPNGQNLTPEDRRKMEADIKRYENFDKEAPTPAETKDWPKLPDNLKAAPIQVSNGKQRIPVTFDSDFDRALYVLGTSTAAKPDNPYLNFLLTHGFDKDAIAEKSQLVPHDVKELSKGVKGPLRVEAITAYKPSEKPENNVSHAQNARSKVKMNGETQQNEGRQNFTPPLTPKRMAELTKLGAEHLKETVSQTEKPVEQPKTPSKETENAHEPEHVLRNVPASPRAEETKALPGHEGQRKADAVPEGANGRSASDLRGGAEQPAAETPADEQQSAGERSLRSDAGRDDEARAAGGTYRPEDITDLQSADVKGENYAIPEGGLLEKRGQRQKAKDNLTAIKLLRTLENENRGASKEEQAQLSLYVGWGGIKNAFADTDGEFKKEWKEFGEDLRNTLSPDEYRIARKTIQYAHYTSETVVRAMWDALDHMGFKGGAIFEPGMGTGNFPGMMPQKMAAKSTYAGIELDPLTARIGKLLYPEYTVRNADFTATPLGENMFDLVIGNPPFSDVKIRSDAKYAAEAFSLHDYFFAKSLDAVAPGGMLAFITSRHSLDKIDPTARKWWAQRADLIGALRLPNTAFKGNAGTEVVTDIIFLKKRNKDEAAKPQDWLDTLKTDSGHLNQYIAGNPRNVLGKHATTSNMYGTNEYTVEPTGDLAEQLKEAIERLPHKLFKGTQKADTSSVDMMPPEKKEGSFYLKDGKLYQVDDSAIGKPVMLRGNGVGGVKADYEKIKLLLPVRDTLRRTMVAMHEGNAGAIARAQVAMSKAYGDFTKKYGPLNKVEYTSRRPSPAALEEARNEARDAAIALGEDFDEGEADLTELLKDRDLETGKRRYTPTDIANERQRLRDVAEREQRLFNEGSFDPNSVENTISERYPNLDVFKSDPEVYALMVLEDYDIETETASKKEIFTQNILAKPKKPDIRTPSDALHYSLNIKNGVDIDFMADQAQLTPKEIVDTLVRDNQIYLQPRSLIDGTDLWTTADDYLSGNVKAKLKEARDAAATDERFNRNKTALDGVQPEDKTVSEIGIGLGAPYVPTKAIEDFMAEQLNIVGRVSFYPAINNWSVSSDERRSAESSFTHGTARMPAVDILSNLLNKKEIAVFDTVLNEKGNETRQLNPVETEAAQTKASSMSEKFDDWIWKSKHGPGIHRYYNDNFNNTVERKYDGKHLTPALSPSIKPMEHQLNVTWRILQSGNTYAAHAVGAGKTLAMIMAGMESRRLGLIKKPMYVVPNHMLGQFSKEFREAYPDAKVYVADEHRFHTHRRKMFVAQVAKNDWDGVVITDSAFQKIPPSAATETMLLRKEISRYEATISAMKADGERRTLSQIEKAKQKIEERIKALGQGDKDQAFSFEDLGVDFLFIDEAHYFRKLSFVTRQGRVRGVDPAGSKMAWDLYAKSRYLDSVKPGRNMVLASGTPVVNTLGEVFTIQRLMDEKTLDMLALNNFDAWASVYANTRTKLEKQPSGNYAQVTRLARFQNLPALSGMIRKFMDVVTSNQLGRLVNRPTLNTGQIQIRTSKPTENFTSYQKVLEKRMQAIKQRGGKVQKGDDIILNVINDGRHAAIDMRLIDPTLPQHQVSKLNDMVDQVFRVWKDTGAKEYRDRKGKIEPTKGATQLIFSDLGIKKRELKGSSFSAYDWMKSRLIKMGIPSDQIAFRRDVQTHDEKRRLDLDVNQGRVRVLIGSTPNMGTGLNVQKRLAAIHNLDAPWFPADLEQRIGRGLRQGNQNTHIDAFGYGTEGSYDATMWGLLETKSSFINAFLSGTNTLPEADDITDTDMFRIAEALVTGDPKVLRRAELIDEITRLERKYKAFTNEQAARRFRVSDNINGIEFRQQRIQQLKDAIKERVETAGDKFKATIDGLTYTERKLAGDALMDHVEKIFKNGRNVPKEGVKVGEVAGFPIRYSLSPKLGDYHRVSLDTPLDDDYAMSWGTERPSGVGIMRSLESAPPKFEAYIKDYEEQIERKKRDTQIIEGEKSETFPKEAELKAKKAELKEIETQLQAQSAEQPVDPRPPPDEADNEMAIDKDEDDDGIKFSTSQPLVWRRIPLNKKAIETPRKVAVGLLSTKIAVPTPEQEKTIAMVHAEVRKLAPGADAHAFAKLEADIDTGSPIAIDGAYFRAFPKAGGVSHIIAWALDSKDPTATVRHEAIHYLRKSGLLTHPEWGALEKTAIERDWLNKHEIAARYPDFNHETQVEEAVADEFADWHKGIDDKYGKLPGRIQRTFKKMDLFRRRVVAGIRDVLGKPPTAQDIFTKMQTGEIGVRNMPNDIIPENNIKSQIEMPLFQRRKPEKPTEEEIEQPYESRLSELRTRLKDATTPYDYIRALTKTVGSTLPERVNNFFDSTGREAMMGLNPMSEGSTEAIALAKDYANSVRLADWKYAELFKKLTDSFDKDQLRNMWDKMDATSVWAQKEQAKSPTKLSFAELAQKAENAGIGIYSLPKAERETVLTLNRVAQSLFEQAQDLEMVAGDGIPFWTPRMAVIIGEDGTINTPGTAGGGKPTLDSKGLNFSTYSANLKQRKHLETEDTEAALQAKFGEDAAVVHDIRAMGLAMRRLERALAGRAFINRIKSISNMMGYKTVRDTPAEGFFTLDHPAFKAYRPKLEKGDDNKWHHVQDEHGAPLFEQYPIYVSNQFEGPLRAILSSKPPLWYRALMQIKMKTIGLIMYSPLMHNAVEWGRAMPAAPGKVASLGIYFQGNAAKRGIGYSGVVPHMLGQHADDKLPQHPMVEAIQNGMVPIGGRAFQQDITSIAEEPNLNPGRSLTAKALGGVSDTAMSLMFGRARGAKAGNAVKEFIDKAGDFYHNKLLWDRVGDLQMGLYMHLRDQLMEDGFDRETAGRMAAHFANRYAGALPLEAMSEASRRLANVLMFSRTFTLGNIGVMKDVMSGLPKDISSQIERDAGEEVMKKAKGAGARKAAAVFALDVAMMRIGNMLLAGALGMLAFDQTLDDILKGYARRLHELMAHLEKNPLDLIPEMISFAESLDPTFDNEPGKINRIKFTTDDKGTAYYMRLPTGKVGEDFVKWLTDPRNTFINKMSAIAKGIDEDLHNDAGFGRKIFDDKAHGFVGGAENVGKALWHIIGGMESFTDMFKGAAALYQDKKTGTGSVLADSMRTFGPLAGITVSKGYPGGPAVGEQNAVIQAYNNAVEAARPDIKNFIERGQYDDAIKMMEDLNMPKGDIKHTLKMYEVPDSRINKSSQRKFEQNATPEQQERFDRAMGNTP